MKDKTSHRGKESNKFLIFPASLLFLILFIVILLGLVLYLASSYNIVFQASDNQSIANALKNTSFSPFDLALVTGLLAGITLSIAFSRLAIPSYLKSSLFLQGAFYVLATIAFIVFGLYLPADKAGLLKNTWTVNVYVVSFFVGGISLTISLTFTLWSLILLLIKNWSRFLKLIKHSLSGEQ